MSVKNQDTISINVTYNVKESCADSSILCLLNQLLIQAISQLTENELSVIKGDLVDGGMG